MLPIFRNIEETVLILLFFFMLKAMSSSSLSTETLNTSSTRKFDFDADLNRDTSDYKLYYYYSSNLIPDMELESTNKSTNSVDLDGQHLVLIEKMTSSVEKIEKSILHDLKVSFNKK